VKRCAIRLLPAFALVMLAACGSPRSQTTPTPVISPTSSPVYVLTADMLPRVGDLVSLPSTWCCDLTPVAANLASGACPRIQSRSISTSFQSDEPWAPKTDVPGVTPFGNRHFAETIFEYSTAQDASQCMSALRQLMRTPGSDRTALSFPALGDETVASTLQALPTRQTHAVDVRRGNLILHIGADDDDRTLSYVTVALAKLDRLLPSVPGSSSTAASTP
jgi:hypothetical protein